MTDVSLEYEVNQSSGRAHVGCVDRNIIIIAEVMQSNERDS